MAILNDLFGTTASARLGIKRLGGAALAAIAGGVLLSGGALAQTITQPAVFDFTPTLIAPGDIQPGDTLQVEFTIASPFITNVVDTGGGVLTGDGAVFQGLSTSVSLTSLGTGGTVTNFSRTTGASFGALALTDPNCDGTGPSRGASVASWSGMSPGTEYSSSFSAPPSCTVAVTFDIPSDITPGDYTLSFADLTGVERSVLVTGTGFGTFITVLTSVELGAATAFSTPLNDVMFTVVADTTGPSGTISAPSGPVAPGEVFGASVVFDESIVGFDASDLVVANGTVSNFVSVTNEAGDTTSFTFDVTAGASGTITIDVGAGAGQDAAGNDNAALAQASLEIAGELRIAASFLGDPPAAGDTTSVRFTIQNTDDTETGDITVFTSNLQEELSGLAILGSATTNTCGSTPSGTTFLIVTGGTVAPSSSCIIEFDVLVPIAATPGSYRVATSNLSYSYPVAGAGVADGGATQLSVAGAEGSGASLAFSKSFTNDPVLPGATVTLEYTIVPEESTDATDLAFTDDLDAILTGLAATGLPQSDVCGTGSTLSGTDTISLSGGNLLDGETCTFSVTVQTPTGSSGDFVSATAQLTGNQDDGSGSVAIDTGFIASDTLTLINQVPQVTIAGPAGPVAVGEDFTITIEFSEPVTGFLVGEIDTSGGVSAAASNLQTSDNEVFTATINPSAAGTVVVALPAGVAQDGDTNDNVAATNYTVTAEVAAPEIAVQFVGASIEINDGDTTPNTAALTDFGTVDATSGQLARTVTISNTGVGELTIASITVSDNANYTLASIPTSVAGGGSATFTITYDPTVAATHAATVTINSDDADEAVFDFAITGTGGSAPEINVVGNSVNIPDGTASTDASDHTQFVSIAAGASGARTFTIENVGGATLTLGVDAVAITNDTDGVFSVTAQPATSIASLGSRTFTVQADPATPGVFTALVSIASDDADENPYTFAIEVEATGAPEVDLRGNGVSIVSGDTTPSTADDTDFEGIAVGSNTSATFTIFNTGNADLVLTAPSGARDVAVERQSGSTDFTISAQPGFSIAAGSSETFNVQYAPTSEGAATAVFEFATNDDDETLYTFTVSGEGLVQEIAVAQGVTDFTTGVTTFAFNGGAGVDLDSGSTPVTFTISNTGATVLTLGTDAVSVSGANSADFTVTDQPDTTVAAGGSTTFEITFNPSALGNRAAAVSIANDDSDESPFTFDLTGVGADLTAPTVISITRGFDGPTPLPTTTNADIVSWFVTFSEDVTHPAASDFSVTTTTSSITISEVSASVYEISLADGDIATVNGTVTLSFAGGQTILDLAGNALTNTTPSGANDNFFIMANDLTPPTVAEVIAVSTPTSDTTPDVTFSTDEAGTLAIGGSCGTALNGTVIGIGNNTITLTAADNSTPLSPGTYSDCTLTMTDAAGNASTPLSFTSFEVDTTSRQLSVADVTLAEGDSGTTDFIFTITSTAAANGDITVDFATADGTAAAGSDYTANSGTATISSGTTSTTVTVSVTGETTFEDDETFTLGLSSATGFLTSISDDTAIGSITNDDTVPTISIADVTAGEGDGTASFTVSLSEASSQTITVDFATADGTAVAGTDYTATSGTLTFTPGDTSETVSVTLTDDALDELDDTFTVDLSNPTNTTIADGSATGTITDNDAAPTLSIDDVTVAEGDGTATFTVSLDAVSGQTVTVDFTTIDGTAVAGSDYTATSGTLTFTPGDTSETVTVSITDDVLDEVSEGYTVGLSSAINATLSDASGAGSITDNDDAPGVSIGDVTVAEGAGTASFTVSLDAASGQSVTVDFATADGTAVAGSDYTANTGTVTFTPGDTSETISVSLTDDALDEADETFTVGLSNPTNVDIADASATGTITDNDATPSLSIADVTAGEGDGTASFTVSLSEASGQTVTVDFATADGTAVAGSDYTAATGTATINAGDTTADITVTITDDGVVETDETYTVTLSNPGNATIADASATGTINNDDTAPFGYTASFDADPINNAGASSASFTFASAVVGATYDFTISSDGGGADVTGSGSVTSASQQVSGIDVSGLGDGTLTLSVFLTDAFGNEGLPVDATATKETTLPGVAITTASADPVSGAFGVTFTFSEDVTGFAVGDIAVGNGAASGLATTSASVYTATITPTADGTVTVDVAADVAQDGSGNGNTAATQFSIESDGTAPGVVIQSVAVGPVRGLFRVTISFDEDVSGFTSGDVTVGNGIVDTFNDSGGNVFQVDIEPTADGPVTVDVASDVAQDGAGNGNTAATQFSIESDLTDPEVTITTASADPVSGVFSITVEFTESVTGFTVGDITVGNGSASNFAGSGATYTADITPTADGTVTVDVAGTVAQDAAGNFNNVAPQFSIESDSTAPDVTITTASSDPVSGAFDVTFTFTEAVTGFTVDDITVGNGAASGFSATSASVYTATITPAADGTVTVDVAAGAAQDDAANLNTAATQFSIESDGSAPTVNSLVLSDTDLRIEDVGVALTATVTFSEALDPTFAPVLTATASEDITATLTFVSGEFSSGNTVYTATYSIADAGQTVADIDIVVNGATDAAGNVMAEFVEADAFSIEMRRGGITVVQNVLGLVDGEFDFSGDLGNFTITTASQTGSEVFADLTEGVYALTLAEEDGFSITGLACNGGSVVTDLGARTATVTLAPGDAVECSFEATADAGLDENEIPQVAISLPSGVDDPTTQTTTFTLTNTGGAPYEFTAITDQPWISVDPNAGTIPASGQLEFTVAFTDAILDLAPGDYTANIIITQAVASGTTSVGGSSTQSVQNITIPVSITLAPREGTLTLIATTAPAVAGEGVFSFSSDITALDGLTLTTVNGTASSDGLTVLRGSYDITQAVSEGWRLDSISCTGDTDGGSTFDVANGTATIDLDPEETLVCTFANRRDEDFIREVTQSAIRSFMAARADQILTHSPDVARRLRGDRAGSTPNRFSVDMTENRLNASLSTSLSAIRQAASERENRMPDQEVFSLDGATGAASIDVWFEASYSSVNDDREGLNADTEFGMYAIGVDMMARENLLVGALVQFDSTETVTGQFRSQVEGDGWLAGPYMAARLSERLVFDARVAWGQSDNQVNPIGTYWDDFETDRWLAEANLVGDMVNGRWRLSPELGIAYFAEEQAQYTDSLGFVIPSQEITLGRITAGPEIAYRFETDDGGVFEPFVKLTAVYDYDQTDVINSSGFLVGQSTFRADARIGIAAEFANGGRLSAEAGLIGLGQGDFEANTGMLRIRLPLSLQ